MVGRGKPALAGLRRVRLGKNWGAMLTRQKLTKGCSQWARSKQGNLEIGTHKGRNGWRDDTWVRLR